MASLKKRSISVGNLSVRGLKGLGNSREVIVGFQFLSYFQEFGVDAGDGFHIDFQFDTHLLAEDVDQLDGGSTTASGKIPDIRIDQYRRR